jgi:hypothetical protein
MALTISKARQNLFALADAASRGEKVQFTYKGNTFQLVAEKKASKLARLKPMPGVIPGVTYETVEEDLRTMNAEIVADWERRNR